jgi:hypothetical protein
VLGCLLAVVALAVLAVGTYALWSIFSGLQKEVSAALVTGAAAVVVSLGSLLGSRYFDARRDQLQRLRDKKAGLYEEFMSSVLGTYFLGVEDQATKDARLKEYFSRMAPGLITWADDGVIVEWARFREVLSNQVVEEGKVALPPLLAFERLLLAIRKDLGHANRGIQTGDILAVWINDIRNSLGPRKD